MEINDAGDWIERAPWRTHMVTIIWIGPGGVVNQAWRLGDKRELLPRPGGTYLAVWTGQHHSEVRRLTPDEVLAVHERIKL